MEIFLTDAEKGLLIQLIYDEFYKRQILLRSRFRGSRPIPCPFRRTVS